MAVKGSIIVIVSLLALCSSGDYTRDHPRDIAALQPRDNVDECQAILFLLKATAFCSTFIGLRDVTRTATQLGPLSTAAVTVRGAPCTVTAAPGTITSATIVPVAGPTVTVISVLDAQTVPSTATVPTPTVLTTTTVDASPIITTSTSTTVTTTTSTFVTTTTPMAKRAMIRASTSSIRTSTLASSIKSSASSIPSPSPTTKRSCTINGLPPKVTNFVCDVISQACSKYVQPKTTTVTALGSNRVTTILQTASAICQTNTPSPTVYVQTILATLPPTTITAISTPAAIIATVLATPQEVTSTITITNAPSTITVSTTTTSTQTTTSTLAVPDSQCTPGLRAPGGFFGSNYESFCGTQCVPFSGFEATTATSTQPNFPACVLFCDDNLAGDAVYNKVTGFCSCNIFQGTRQSNPSYDCAKNRSAGAQRDKKR